jgi:putative peptidoglycan lipid II flippase
MNDKAKGMDRDNGELIRASVSVTLFTVASLALGFVSQVLIAYYFGTSGELDCYLIAYAVPSLFLGVSGSVFSSCLIPALTPLKGSEAMMRSAVAGALLVTMALATGITAAGFLSRGLVLGATTNLRGGDLDRAVRLSGALWPVVGITMLVSFLSALYQLSRSFTRPAAIHLLPTIGMIGGTVLLAGRLGIMGLILGALALSVVSLILMLPAALARLKAPFRLDARATWGSDFVKSIVPVAVSILPFTALPTIDAFWASGLPPGSMSYIGYSTRLTLALGSLVLNGIYMTILPYLSDDLRNGAEDVFISRLRASVKAVLLVFTPAALILMFYRHEAVEVLLRRGMFTEESVNGVASVLPYYLAGLLGMGPATLISRAYFARRESRRFGALSLVFIAVYFALSGLLSRGFSYPGIGAAYLIYWASFSITGAMMLDRKTISGASLRYALKVSSGSLASVALSWLVSTRLHALGPFARLSVGAGISIVLFALACYALRINEAFAIARYIYNGSLERISNAL